MRVGVVGINHKLADVQLRELLAHACNKHFSSENPFHEEHTFVLLSTCNRTEVYFSSEDLAASHSYLLNILRREVSQEFEHKLYSYFGSDCFLHIASVTAGLDSAITGETEIQGQVKSSYEKRANRSQIPAALHFMFQKSLKIGKKVRTKLQLGRGMPDIEHSVLSTGLSQFGDIWHKKVLFVGASEINQKICHFLQRQGLTNLTITNRTNNRATRFAEHHQISSLPWEELSSWTSYEWVIVGTKSPTYVLSPEAFHSNPYSQLLIDLSVPRNINPDLEKNPSITLLNIDQLNKGIKHRTQQLHEQMLLSELMVIDEVKKQTLLFLKKGQTRLLRLVQG